MTLYIATNLSRYETDLATDDPNTRPADLRVNGQVYRALSPEYYAYLRSQMARLKTAHDAGSVSPDIYRPLADRFNDVHADAVASYGEEALRTAMRSFNPRAYQLPGEAGEVIDMPATPARSWGGQGSLAGFAAAPVAPGTSPVTYGQRIRCSAGEVVIVGYHTADEYFPEGWVDVVTDSGVTGQVDLRYACDLQDHAIVPMTLTPAEARIVALPDEPFDLPDICIASAFESMAVPTMCAR